MSNTGLVVAGKAAVATRREWEDQLDLIKQTVAPGLSDAEFGLFCHVARARNLDPLQRQIYAVKRATWNPESREKESRMVLQVGIDGFRSIANRTGLYMPSDRLPLTEGQGKTDLRVTVWVKKYHPMSGQWHEFGATALYREYVQTKSGQGGNQVPNSMWERMPISQLTKCAEALALRRGWPEELGQIYTDEEMQHVEPSPVVQQATRKQDRTQREMGTLKVSSEPNRGHGNEGTQKSAEPTICAECRGIDGHADGCPLAPAPPIQTGELWGEEDSEASTRWKTAVGHDPKKHISFKQGKLLFVIQKKLGLPEEVMKNLLLEDFKIEHRYLIPKDVFPKLLDTIDPDFRHHEMK